MKHGDRYLHFKGGEYFFQGIALPLKEGNLSHETVKNMMFLGTVRYHENTHDIELYSIDGAMFIDSDKPHVIYKNPLKNSWAREVDDFFGYKHVTGSHYIKRFTLKKSCQNTLVLDYQEAINVIKANYPPENYTMLREALDLAINLLEKEDNKVLGD